MIRTAPRRILLWTTFLWLYSLLFISILSLAEALTHYNETMTSGLFWNDLSVQSADGNYLLAYFNGFIPSGTICGILGPSGAGKSTTLASLGGTISPYSGLQVTGDVLYYDSDKHTSEHLQVQGGQVAWLQQKDNFFSMLTVKETLELAAFLELPQFTELQRLRRVNGILDSLGLSKLKDRKIGDSAMHQGLSGGERRRLSLALELISSPKLFIGDEPTSGLVSTMELFSRRSYCSAHSNKFPTTPGFDT